MGLLSSACPVFDQHRNGGSQSQAKAGQPEALKPAQFVDMKQSRKCFRHNPKCHHHIAVQALAPPTSAGTAATRLFGGKFRATPDIPGCPGRELHLFLSFFLSAAPKPFGLGNASVFPGRTCSSSGYKGGLCWALFYMRRPSFQTVESLQTEVGGEEGDVERSRRMLQRGTELSCS